MLGVVYGFSVILVVIAAGYLAARFGVVEGEQRVVLNNVAFYVATPALLVSVLHDADPGVVLSPVILVATLAAVIAAALFVIASRLWFKRDLASTALGAACSGFANTGNLGLPVAMYILGDAAYVVPMMLVQVIVFAPVVIALLETARGGGGALKAIGRSASNPVIIASVVGLLLALLDIPVPEIVLEPIDMLGAAAIPMVLLSFGISLRGQRALQPGGERVAVFTASGLTLFAMPLIAWGICLLLGLGARDTFAAVVISALPTAQNIYSFAATYRRAEVMVRDTVFLTTFASLPVIALITWLLGP